jgi:dihydroorotase
VIIDPQAEWTVEPDLFASKGKNTPLEGRRLKGRVVATIHGGRIAFDGH